MSEVTTLDDGGNTGGGTTTAAPHGTEIWRAAAGYEGAYEVSSQGRVRSLDRVVIRPNGTKVPYRGRVLRQNSDSDRPYLRVVLNKQAQRTCKVHRLVAEAFLPRPEGSQVVRHLDGDATNNRIENLCWGTYSENRYDDVRLGTHPQVVKVHCPRGHQLVEPNLRRAPEGRSWRACLSCKRAQGRKRLPDGMDIQAMANVYYARLGLAA